MDSQVVKFESPQTIYVQLFFSAHAGHSQREIQNHIGHTRQQSWLKRTGLADGLLCEVIFCDDHAVV